MPTPRAGNTSGPPPYASQVIGRPPDLNSVYLYAPQPADRARIEDAIDSTLGSVGLVQKLCSALPLNPR